MIDEIDLQIETLMMKINSPLLIIPDVSFRLGSVILAEIRNINNFFHLHNYLLLAAWILLFISQENSSVKEKWSNEVPFIFDRH